jgi:hypothetical protein
MNANQILKSANCELTVVCGRNWDDFDKTEEDGIKFCNHCKQAVFLTRTSAEVRIAAEKGLCVYIVPMSEAWEGSRVLDITRADLRAAEAKALQRIKVGT